MAALKRKSNTHDSSTSAKQFTKRIKVDSTEASSKRTDKQDSKSSDRQFRSEFVKKIPPSSFLANEQPAFPRGGAGLLTPLERKQIQARAERDAVAEQGRSGDLFSASGVAQTLSEDEDEEAGTQVRQTASQKKAKRSKKSAVTEEAEERAVRIEGLSRKRLSIGSLILGQITSIGVQDMTLALPNNLTGHVPLTSISKQLTSKIEKLLQEEDGEENDEELGNEDDDVVLSDYFHEGQYLRVSVTSTGNEVRDTLSHNKKTIELSIDPILTNKGLTSSNVSAGCTVQASVVSVEDHGIVMDLGFEESRIKGFIGTKDLSQSSALSNIKVGSVFLCLVSDVGSNGRIIKLSAKESKLGSLSKSHILSNAPNIDSFLPGTAVEILLSEVTTAGLAGKVMGMLDVTADIVHSGFRDEAENFHGKYKPGLKIKGRLICTFPHSDSKKLGFSVLDNVLGVRSQTSDEANSQRGLDLSAVVPKAKVRRVEPGLGLFLELNSGFTGFAHISRLADSRVDNISETTGQYKLTSLHTARILDFNPFDNLFIVSLQPSVIKQPFLRIEDVQIGEVAKGTVTTVLIGEKGVRGLLVSLADGISGLVPYIHLSDIVLQNPEKKFREGSNVTARVLTVDAAKQQIRLTLKKSLVNSDQKIWSNYENISSGDSTPGVLVKVEKHGAIVQFYGPVKGFLPVSEMSEAYIKDATQHFREGQVVTVNAISVDPENQKLTVSCRELSTSNVSMESTVASLEPGTLVSGTVFEKSNDDVLLRLAGSGVIARLSVDHASDGSLKKRALALSKIRVGQTLQHLILLEVHAKRRLVILANRSSLVAAAQKGTLLKSFDGLKEGSEVTGFVTNITADGIFVGFAGGLSGLVPKKQLSPGTENQEDFGHVLFQPVTTLVSSIDYRGAVPRFWLSMRASPVDAASSNNKTNASSITVVDPVDPGIRSLDDLTVGRVLNARVVSVKETQINVSLAKDIQGRIDVSEVFDAWEEIKDRKRPLRNFSAKDVLSVRILGGHDARNHKFLPISHRSGKTPVFELSAKKSVIQSPQLDILHLEKLKPGSAWLAFVNNVSEDCLWVNISPTVRGRIRAVDVSDDISLAADLEAHFPLGSALRVQVTSVDVEKNYLDLTAKRSGGTVPLTVTEISTGMILPGKITKVSDRQILVQLSDNLVGAVDLVDMADDYSQADPARHQKNEVVKVCVIGVDVPNKKIVLSTRPSKVLSSSLEVTDAEITSIEQIELNRVVRGFINNVTDKGVFVMLGQGIIAFVRVSNLSDAYLKQWKDHFQRDQLVTGKVIQVDKATKHVQMSLKESVIDANYKAPLTFIDMHPGDIVTGTVAKVEAFGVFILVDHSENVRGLCHRSEMAEQRIDDASTLFREGDVVKAKVLKVELDKRRINFGMKASYFTAAGGSDEMEATSDEGDDGVALRDEADTRDAEDSAAELADNDPEDEDADDDDDDDVSSRNETEEAADTSRTLTVGGFDWHGMSNGRTKRPATTSDAEDEETEARHTKRKRRAEIHLDQTGDLDATGPQSADDYERLLLGESDSSALWLQYMAFHLDLGDIDQARQIGARALKSIGLTQDREKLNIWIALLNLENAYGDEERVAQTFRRACEFHDSHEVHTRLSSIYIQSGRVDQADALFQVMVKKFAQDPQIWTNYASFLFDTVGDAARARALLPRALQTLPAFTHVGVTSKFGQLEFRSAAGVAERGRTIFAGLVSAFPKRVDLFNVLLDLELQAGDAEQVRALFERLLARSTTKLKAKQAKFFFKRWLAFEATQGDGGRGPQVQAAAAAWVQQARAES